MRLWAHAKVNLGLRVTGVRPDGYHEIDSLLVSVDLADLVIVEPGGPSLSLLGPESQGVPLGYENLAVRAAAGAAVRINIEKNIPVGAGLGGGSADAAAVLHALGHGDDLEAGARLGADVPFCMTGGAARVRDTGDVLEPVPIPELLLVLAVPPVRLATSAVYEEWDRGGPGELVAVDVPGVGQVVNDLTGPAGRLSPELVATREALERATGRSWLMTGSGAALLLPVLDEEEARAVAARVHGRVLHPVERGVRPG